MPTYKDQMRSLTLEARLERKKVIQYDYISFYDILRANAEKDKSYTSEVKYPTKDTERDRKGNIIKVIDALARAQDINHSGTLKKYANNAKVNLDDLISLHADVKPHALGLDQFLANHYTDRYKDEYLGFEGQKWRYWICEKTLEYVVLDNKTEGYLRKEKTFIDEDAAFFYAMTYKNRKMIKEVNRSLEHIASFDRMKEDKEAFREVCKEEVQKFFTLWHQELRTIPSPQYTALLRAIERDEIEEAEERAREQEDINE